MKKQKTHKGMQQNVIVIGDAEGQIAQAVVHNQDDEEEAKTVMLDLAKLHIDGKIDRAAV